MENGGRLALDCVNRLSSESLSFFIETRHSKILYLDANTEYWLEMINDSCKSGVYEIVDNIFFDRQCR